MLKKIVKHTLVLSLVGLIAVSCFMKPTKILATKVDNMKISSGNEVEIAPLSEDAGEVAEYYVSRDTIFQRNVNHSNNEILGVIARGSRITGTPVEDAVKTTYGGQTGYIYAIDLSENVVNPVTIDKDGTETEYISFDNAEVIYPYTHYFDDFSEAAENALVLFGTDSRATDNYLILSNTEHINLSFAVLNTLYLSGCEDFTFYVTTDQQYVSAAVRIILEDYTSHLNSGRETIDVGYLYDHSGHFSFLNNVSDCNIQIALSSSEVLNITQDGEDVDCTEEDGMLWFPAGNLHDVAFHPLSSDDKQILTENTGISEDGEILDETGNSDNAGNMALVVGIVSVVLVIFLLMLVRIQKFAFKNTQKQR